MSDLHNRLRRQRVRLYLIEPPTLQTEYAVATTRKREIVGSNKGGQPVVAMKPSDQIKYRLSGSSIQISGRFIRQQKLRIGDQRSRDGDSLLFSAGKLTGSMVRAIFQSDFAQPFTSFVFRLTRVFVSHQQRHGHVFNRREFRQQVMKLPDVSNRTVAKIRGCLIGKRLQLKLGAVYVTLRSTIKRSEDVQQGALARATLADDGDHLPLPNLEGQVVKDHQV